VSARAGRRAGVASVASFVFASMLVSSPARAAFEWEHPSPESWIAAESPYRWPIAEAGARSRVDLAAARPWSWSEVRASAVRAALGRPTWTAGLSLAQLATGSYRETRLAGGWERRLGAQGLAVIASLVDVRAESARTIRVTGGELDLAWTSDLGWFRLRAAATGIVQSRGAVAVGVPRALGVSVRSRGPGAQLAARFEEGSRGRRLVLGLMAPVGPLVLGAGWSTGEPSVRCLAGIRRGSLALTAGIAWHTELPPSQVIALALAAREPEP